MNVLKSAQLKHRPQFHGSRVNPSSSTNMAAKDTILPEHPFEVIARIRDHADGKDEQPISIMQMNHQRQSIRIHADSGDCDFTIDGVSLSEKEDLGAFYSKFIQPRVERVKLGDKCTILVYGSTGSGKSETMFGCSTQPGILYRFLRDILGGGKEYGVQVSVMEIYNEEVYDLLSNNGGGGFGVGYSKGNNSSNSKVKLEIVGRKSKNATYISGYEAGKLSKEIQKAEKRRIFKSTICNDKSFQSHCLIIINVPMVGGRLMLVDMAGSENLEQAGEIGSESKMLMAKTNQGNMALKKVVKSIANGDSHIPFRSSKLTMFLQDSFEDDKSKPLMILCGSLDRKEIHMMISTLEYGTKAKSTVRGPNMPIKDKVGLEACSSAGFLGTSVTTIDECKLKLHRENKLREERNEEKKESLKMETDHAAAAAAALRSEIELGAGSASGANQEEISLKVNLGNQIIKRDSENELEDRHNQPHQVVLSDGKALNGVRGSESGKQRKEIGSSGSKASELSENLIKVSMKYKDGKFDGTSERKGSASKEVEEISKNQKYLYGVRVLGKFDGHVSSTSSLLNPNRLGINRTVESIDKKISSTYDIKASKSFDNNGAIRGCDSGVNLGKKVGDKFENDVKILKVLEEKGTGDEGIGERGGIKYPSKLHEKLAFLEGKVKRIATDIKKTKEMLDKNNPDASRVILSDIQNKISGIEKAVGHVVVDADSEIGVLKETGHDVQELKMVEKNQVGQVDKRKSYVKGFSGEELEARLFPHHKLLRKQSNLNASVDSSHDTESHVGELGVELMENAKAISPIDENPIAIEFLASLNKEPTPAFAKEELACLPFCEVQEMEGVTATNARDSFNVTIGKDNSEIDLASHEKLDDFDDHENITLVSEVMEDASIYQMNEIGCRTSTGGWFVSEGESVLLAHDDGSCTFYDIVNSEEKAVYKPPAGFSASMWRDCWLIRAPSADGCTGRYVVAASAGNTMESGFCSWDFYSKDVQAFHFDHGTTPSSRSAVGSLSSSISYRRNALCNLSEPETRQWWYKPCGPLMAFAASYERVVRISDIRDGEQIMKWNVQKPVLKMDYSIPLQWRNKGKLIVTEAENISLWDVNSMNPQALVSISSSGRQVSAIHINNTDAELGGGVRQRVSSSEAEGNDGIFCTLDSINILDFRHPTGIGLRISKLGVNVQSVFSRGESIFLGCMNLSSKGKKQSSSEVQQFSLRKQSLLSTYAMPEDNIASHHATITQVWGNANTVMGVSGLGLYVFDALKDNEMQSFAADYGKTQVKEILGPDDLYSPSFDYSASRALLISRDRPAMWRYLS